MATALALTVADDALPFVDEHHVVVQAPADAVWRALGRRTPGGRHMAHAVATLLGAEPRHASGEPLVAGSTIPGFTVADADPARLARLVGRHRFSRYALELTLAEGPGGTTLTARTFAAFPGLRGRVYRGLVVGSGAHRGLVGRLLRAVRRSAEDGR